MVLEKTLESLLDSKEIKTVIPKRKCEVKVKFAQLCLTLWDLIVYTVHGILPARILTWVAILFYRRFSQPVIKPRSPALQANSLPSEPPGKTYPI